VKYIGKRFKAEALINALKNAMLSKVQGGKIWKNNFQNESAYQKATLLLTYHFADKHEVMGARYYSGPYDCVGVQYTIHPKDNQLDSELIKKLKGFLIN
jgi:hypothetical protein